jgi:tetratricopeptide (TPR) repeat protein
MNLCFPAPEERMGATIAFNEGVQAMRQGDDATAIAHWERAAEIDQTLVPAIHNLVVYHEGRKQFDRVVDLYERILRIDPYHTRSLVRQAVALRRSKRLNDAIQNYQRAIAVHPWFRHWYDELADLYDDVGEKGVATNWRERAAKLDLDETEMASEDGLKSLKRGNHDLAIACFEAVLDELPGHIEARVMLAEALHATGGTAAALSHLQTALEHAKDTPAIVHYHRARIYFDTQRYAEAGTELRIALDIEPGYGRAEYLLALVETVLENESTNLPDPAADVAARSQTSGHTSAAPVARPSDAWSEQVGLVLHDAIANNKNTDQPVRFALIVEPHATLAPTAMRVAELVASLDLPGPSKGAMPLFVVASEGRPGEGVAGVVAQGWLGSEELPELRALNWTPVTSGVPLDQLINGAIGASESGYDAMFVVSTGRGRGDQSSLARIAKSARLGHVVHLHPADSAVEVNDRLKSITPDFSSISLE